MNGRPIIYRKPGLVTAIGEVLYNYGRAWASYALGAIIIAGIANGIYRIPLWQVVDVNLSVFFFFVALFAVLYIIGMILDLVGGEWSEALARLLGLFMVALLPFGAIAGYAAYGWMTDSTIAGQSFVYDGFLALFQRGYELTALQAGDFLGVIGKVKAGTSDKPAVDIRQLANFAIITSFALALVGFMLGRSRALLTTADTLTTDLFSRLNLWPLRLR